MTYVPTHRFDQADDGAWCGVAVPSERRNGAAICCQPEDHPVHDVGNAALEDLARALAAHTWVRRAGDDELSAKIRQHRNHSHHAECALCNGDVHAVAAFVLAYLRGRENDEPDPDDPVRLADSMALAAARLASITRKHWNTQHPDNPITDPPKEP